MDYFIASLSYGPKIASGFISPLSAECMLQYKKKAAAYMKALRKVRDLLLTFKSEEKSGIIPENGKSFCTTHTTVFKFYTISKHRCLVGVVGILGGRDNRDPNLICDICIGRAGVTSPLPGRQFRMTQPGSQCQTSENLKLVETEK